MPRNLSIAQKQKVIWVGVKQLGVLRAVLPAAGGQRGFGGGAPNVAAIFLAFSKKIKHFLSIFWSKFLLRPQGLHAPVSKFFCSFFSKNNALFLSIFWSKCLL